jgi:hypothetical protein
VSPSVPIGLRNGGVYVRELPCGCIDLRSRCATPHAAIARILGIDPRTLLCPQHSEGATTPP